MTAPILARDISAAAESKPLGRFGCKVIRRPVPEARAQADQDDALEQRKS